MGKEGKGGRSKFHYGRRTGKEFDVHPGMHGVMITCHRGQESRCSAEACQLLEKALDEVQMEITEGPAQGQPSSTKDSGEILFEDQLAAEVASLKNAKQRLFQPVSTGELSCIIIIKLSASVGPPVDICQRLFERAENGSFASARFCQRIIPLSCVFKASLEDLRREASLLIAPLFHRGGDVRHTFAVQFESRLSHLLDRKVVIDLIADLVGCTHTVKLDGSAHYTIMVQVFKGMCGMSILPKYQAYHKYNIQECYRANIAAELLAKE